MLQLQDFLAHVDSGAAIEGGSEQHRFMHDAAQEAFRITARINNEHRAPEEVRTLLSELTGKPIDDSVTVFPPFHTEFGKNLTLGRGVFINLGCRFQDTGGITIGDDGVGRDVLGDHGAGVPAKVIRSTGFDAQA